ncbi:endonuclease/exonuclease/phosphatase family metal-dependent hydrolase [Pontibacter mucosus]|uniref:Endonuclease/exonuclease/phosphatase family metal-dependent hydrolase n=1 Tax=Pontibacter mucosus TaxID=1649266 RepID=A0A2T5Y3F1_9BACT|nr:endonuclease/exonuclease/phosphatase family protein [Pontibacter mucosus]PTX10702.1 endonuclease/exonuclease/phosphatase family metal-dependent hydrolase [Pontibacter mucosus]
MNLKRLFLLFFLAGFVSLAQAQQLRVASYNIRFDNPRDTGNLWVDRAPYVAELLRFHDFDVFGTQEGLKHQLDDISKALPQYERFGAGRDDGKDKGEHSAIFFKKDRFTVLDKGNFWLSETPDKPSLGWDATCCHRITSWVYLQDKKTKQRFYFFNAHFDHQGVQARNESSKLILRKMEEIAGKNPVILAGDFNGDHASAWYKLLAESNLLKDTYREVTHPYANNASFNGFKQDTKRDEVIDHVFVSDHFSVNKWGILTDTYYGKFPSDHFPILVDLTYGRKGGKK